MSTQAGLDNLHNREVWLAHTLPALPAGWRILDAGAGELAYRRLPQAAEKYAGERPNRLTRLAIRLVLRLLGEFSERDTGSKDMLAYGLHVRARKTAAD